MNPPTFTPGPWTSCRTTLSIRRWIISPEEVSAIEVTPSSDTAYTIAYIPNDYESERQAANAALIAAAPDLYAALELLTAEIERLGLIGLVLRDAHLALAKARGENV